MLVKDLYQDCLLYEESSLAHYLYHLLAEGKISLWDDSSRIDLNHADQHKVAKMIQTNVLGFHRVGIYSLKMNKKAFAFIYASSQEEAIQFYNQSFQKTPLNCHEYPLDLELTRGNGVISFREMKKEFKSFPAIAGYFVRGRIP
ncbi:hypothetical protein E2K98_04620 [Bacillus salipaludis]|uniref:Uncharacterized protein n=1 Tax=Bacillus salipaludis TaxID=2547811 RepID=A0A4R5VXQ6_9BACI|nr:hypothetical protein [Bacillus salipaludis]TDK64150.1 hypothetical protein E2K98_04620 [Bacillus salipaludis]